MAAAAHSPPGGRGTGLCRSAGLILGACREKPIVTVSPPLPAHGVLTPRHWILRRSKCTWACSCIVSVKAGDDAMRHIWAASFLVIARHVIVLTPCRCCGRQTRCCMKGRCGRGAASDASPAA